MKRLIIYLFVIAVFQTSGVLSQESPTYQLEHVHSIVNADNTKAILIFKVTPHKPEEFKLVASMRVSYCFGLECKPTTIDLMKQKKPQINITVYDDSIEEYFDLLKERTEIAPESIFLVFTFSQLKEGNIEKMHFTYGLWEHDNLDVRHEKTFFIELEKVF